MDDNALKTDAGEQQNVVGLGFCGPSAGSNTSVAEAKDGKLIRLRPLHFDWKYERESLNPWRMEVRGSHALVFGRLAGLHAASNNS